MGTLVINPFALGTPTLGPVAVMAANGNNCGSTAGTSVTLTLPSGLSTGKGFLVICTNSTSDTITSDPSGWSLIDGPSTVSTTLEGWIYAKDITSGDSSAAVSATLSGSGRWCIGFIAFTGAGANETLTAEVADSTADTALAVGNVTPTANDAMLVTMSVARAASTSGQTCSVGAGYTEQVDTSTSFAASANTNIYIATKLLSGQAGVPQTGPSHTCTQSVIDVSWHLVIPPG